MTYTRVALLATIYDFFQARQRLPSTSELAASGRIKARGKFVRDLQALEARGYISRARHDWPSGIVTTLGIFAAEWAKMELVNPERRWSYQHRRKHVINSATLKAGRTMHAEKVRDAAAPVLMKGSNNIKLGGMVTKGRWRGMPIFSLTLEERATCPRTCLQWRNCYGNNMSFAVRYNPGEALEQAVARDLWRLSRKHPQGIVVRLHILGDFYSVDYVRFWHQMMKAHSRLRVFGFTAWSPETQIGGAIHTILNGSFGDRCWIRFSGGAGAFSTKVVSSVAGLDPAKVIVCPEQLERVRTCGACGLCWTASKPIVFLEH